VEQERIAAMKAKWLGSALKPPNATRAREALAVKAFIGSETAEALAAESALRNARIRENKEQLSREGRMARGHMLHRVCPPTAS
jgi:hypothetical protein